MMAPHANMAKVAPRLGQLIRMLSSNSDGEALNAARALGRTLAGVTLDFNDLAAAVEGRAGPFVYSPPPRPTYRPDPRPTDPPSATKPTRSKSGPRPWPAWKDLTHAERVAWLSAIDDSHSLERNTRTEFDAFRSQMIFRPHEAPGSGRVSLFNRLVRSAWKKGARI